MKKLLLILFVCFSFFSKGQNLYFPPISGTTWDTISPSSLGFCTNFEDTLHAYLQKTNSKAFILLKNGKIVYEWYFGTFTKDSFYVWNSAGKTLTGFAVGIAQQEGFLKLSDTTSHYLGQGWTSLTPQEEEKITIWNQITMTTGLNHTGDYHCTDPTCLIYIADPGTRWMYHNAPYTLLDGVIEAATGINLNTYVSQKIRSKIGMNGLYVQSGYNNINVSNARSMARFGLLLLGKGTWNGTAILSDTNYFKAMTNTSQNFNLGYGYLTWLNGKGSYMLPSPDFQVTINENALPNAPADLFAALGKNGQIINVVPSQNLVLIRMGVDMGTSLVGNQYNDTIWQKFNLINCTASNVKLEKQEILISPNPTKDILEIKTNLKIKAIEIRDMSGKIIAVNFSKNLDVSHLESGIYFLRLETENGISQLRFLKE